MPQQKETERVREIFDASAAQYDKGIAFSVGDCTPARTKPGSTC